MKINKKQIESIIGNISNYTNYNGRKFNIEFSDTVIFYDTNWSGGTKNTYIGIDLNNMNNKNVAVNAPWNNPIEGKMISLSDNGAILKHTDFCGHDLGITLYLNNSHLPKWLN
jgi:hypothetical protein